MLKIDIKRPYRWWFRDRLTGYRRELSFRNQPSKNQHDLVEDVEDSKIVAPNHLVPQSAGMSPGYRPQSAEPSFPRENRIIHGSFSRSSQAATKKESVPTDSGISSFNPRNLRPSSAAGD